MGFHPDVEWHVLGALPDQGVYRGVEGIARFWEMWSETFEGFRVDIEELVDAGDGVVALVAASGSGRASELPTRTPTCAGLDLRG